MHIHMCICIYIYIYMMLLLLLLLSLLLSAALGVTPRRSARSDRRVTGKVLVLELCC